MNVTPRRHAELKASITFVPSTNRGPPSVSLLRLCLVPVNNSSILSEFNFRQFADIQLPISCMQRSNTSLCSVCSVPIHLSTLPCCEIRSGYRAACRRRKHITSHHAWLPSLQDRPCIIKTIADPTIADPRRITAERSISPA